MKRLSEEVILKTKFEVITMTELRSRPGEVLDSVALGKTYLVTRAGVPMGVISKPPGEQLVTVIDSEGKTTFHL